MVEVETGERRRLASFDDARLAQLASWSGDGQRLLFWLNVSGSASLAAGGLPLKAVSVSGERTVELAPSSLPNEDSVSACGAGVVFVVGSGRDARSGKSLWRAGPPTWTPTQVLDGPRSFAAPACSPDGERIAVAASPDRLDRVSGETTRGLRLISLVLDARRQLTGPPAAKASDESPAMVVVGRVGAVPADHRGGRHRQPWSAGVRDALKGRQRRGHCRARREGRTERSVLRTLRLGATPCLGPTVRRPAEVSASS